MDRRFVLEYVRVTEAAAVACAALVGRGKKDEADGLAVAAMRSAFDKVPARGTVVIGEGEMDEAPMLYIGEQVGPHHDTTLPELDIAVDPLEGTTLCAKGMPGAIAVLAVTEKGNLLRAPDIYMEKIAAGPAGRGVVSLQRSPQENVRALAQAKGCSPDDLTVVILDRPRHNTLIAAVREAGARVRLITDGDVSPAVACGLPDAEVDMVMGIGGAPEGVLAAAALRCLGGEFQGRLIFEDEGQRERARSMGVRDPDAILGLEELVGHEDCIFVASGVTDGHLLRGVKRQGSQVRVHSLAIRSWKGTLRFFETLTSAPLESK
jgi:fructose-1,6-bisphosphatase II